jgi:hypothetical protein
LGKVVDRLGAAEGSLDPAPICFHKITAQRGDSGVAIFDRIESPLNWSHRSLTHPYPTEDSLALARSAAVHLGVEDVDEHGPGVQIDATVKSVLAGVAWHVLGPRR